MTNSHKISLFLLLLLLASCNMFNGKEISEKPTEWKKLHDGLYLSPDAELGFASDPEIANVPKAELEAERCENVFITHIGHERKKSLGTVIDTNTFEALGAGFFKDKSNIYSHYAMCDGGYLTIFADDTTSFRVLGTSYASYQSHIYHYRNGRMDADPNTFKTSPESGPYAKDKNGFFAFGERISEEQLKADAGPETVDALKKL